MTKLTIDGKQIEAAAGSSILDAALAAGIYIPHLCNHPNLTPVGSCGMCVVEVGGQTVRSCVTQAEEGMSVSTKSEGAVAERNLAMKLLMAAHPEDCSTCVKYGNCELQTLIQYIGASTDGMHRRVKNFRTLKDNPLFDHDMVRCVLCGRCVRACGEMRGIKTLGYQKKEDEVYTGVPAGELLIDEDCRYCGACAEVCPTGAISDKKELTDASKSRADVLVPCRSACPAGTDIPEYVRLVKEGKYEQASAVIREKLPIPKILGNVCSHICETECRRGEVNDAISIRNIKLVAVENDTQNAWKERRKFLPDTGKTVAVVGGGPAGLTAAYYLRKQGHGVTLFERMPQAGGMARYGIPAYRMPEETVQEEVDLITDIGVNIEYNKQVDDIAGLKAQYDAVVVAVGACAGNRLRIEGSDLPGAHSAVDFLREVRLGGMKEKLGRVFVVGGGNVAFDCARTAVRMGAEKVMLSCLECGQTIPGDEEEVEAAIREGIEIRYSKSFVKLLGTEHVEGIMTIDVESLTIEAGRMDIVTTAGTEEEIPCDTVIFATGQRPGLDEDCGLELGMQCRVAVNGECDTTVEGIFAAGDAVTGTDSIVRAVAGGRIAASRADKYLGGDGEIDEVLTDREAHVQNIGRVEGFGLLPREEVVSEAIYGVAEQKQVHCAAASGEAFRCLQCDLRLDIEKPKTWNRMEG